jgi:hypothetical protein
LCTSEIYLAAGERRLKNPIGNQYIRMCEEKVAAQLFCSKKCAPFSSFHPLFIACAKEQRHGDIAGPIIIPAKRSRLSNSLSASDFIFI